MSFPQYSFSYTVDPIQCGGGLLDYIEHEYQKVKIIEDLGHLEAGYHIPVIIVQLCLWDPNRKRNLLFSLEFHGFW